MALGFLRRVDGKYHNAPEADLFLDKNKPSYVGGILEMANHRLFRFWGRLTDALRTGQPQNEAREGGAAFFAALYSEPARLKQFLAAMTGLSRGSSLAIAAKFPWKSYRTFTDVGTAQGDTAVQIAKAHPHLRGTGFDLGVVAPIFDEYVAQQGLTDRVSFVAGDFFQDPLPRADVVVMGHILHDWGHAQKLELLRKGHEAIPEGGAMIVYEAIIDDERSQNAFGLLMSLNMLIETPAGFDYTGADCQGWMQEAGFQNVRIVPLQGPYSMAVAHK